MRVFQKLTKGHHQRGKEDTDGQVEHDSPDFLRTSVKGGSTCDRMRGTSAFDQVGALTDEIRYNRRLIHNDAAGMPTDQPMDNFVAEKKEDELLDTKRTSEKHRLISHQTGA